ncbi:hypothetical protein D3874_11855 [Oleomonas cavernae]|uniref:Uncharacterized protein n=1 Tax=Oleomonas cavernae TaxID=2320859 RepID=A0A418WCC6_9PROT|nr:hypothetical protein D3874_11855 [Oleomonas cavernae]
MVVLDPKFGESLRNHWPGQAIWIVKSPTNEPVVRSIWAAFHANDLTDITMFDNTPESPFLSTLDALDLHHGTLSTDLPYGALKVIGTELTEQIRLALGRLGFGKISQNFDGFEAIRTGDAMRLVAEIEPPRSW